MDFCHGKGLSETRSRANHNSQVIIGIRSLQRSHCFGVASLGRVQWRRCASMRYQWSTANRRRYSRQISDKGSICSPIHANHNGFATRTDPSELKRSTRTTDIGCFAAARKCKLCQTRTRMRPSFASSTSKASEELFQVSGSFNLNLLPCIRGLPRPEYGGGACHKHRFERKRINLSAGILAVFNTNGAHPYSLSHNDIGLVAKNLHTCLNCHTALWIGLSHPVILSCLNGKAQLPESSGIQAIVL